MEKAKPVVRQGRKAMGLLRKKDRQVAMENGWCLFFFTKQRIKSG
jgi:hypothetical protein